MKGRSEPSVGTITELPSWTPIVMSELLCSGPDRFVRRILQRAAHARVGPDEGGREAELVCGPPHLGDRGGGVLHRNHRRAEQPRRVRGAIRREPVVVGLGDRYRRLRVGDRPRVEADRREEHRLVDPLGVHVGEAYGPGPTRRAEPRPATGTTRSPRSPSPAWRECRAGQRESRLPATTTCS